MEIFILIVLWYLIGLVGSHIAISHGKFFSWGDTLGFGLCMALFGPINLFAGIAFALTNS